MYSLPFQRVDIRKPTICFETVHSMNLELTDWMHWAASKPKGCFCLCLYSNGITNLHYHAYIFQVGTQVLILHRKRYTN